MQGAGSFLAKIRNKVRKRANIKKLRGQKALLNEYTNSGHVGQDVKQR